LLLGVFGIVLCNVNAGRFWSLEYRFWNWIVQHALVLLDSGVVIFIFIFCLIWMGLELGVGLWVGASTLLLQMGKVF